MITKTMLNAVAMAAVLTIGTAGAHAAGKGQGAGMGGMSGMYGMGGMAGMSGTSGKANAPGQTGIKPTHPDNRGAVASNCAKISDPKLKDECVRASKP